MTFLTKSSRMSVKICCIKLSLATRVIAMIGLITSVLVLIQIFTDLAEQGKTSGTVSILLGLDIDEIILKANMQNNAALDKWLKIGYMVFAMLFAIASAILIWGSIVEINYFAYPWLVCESLSSIAQIVSILLMLSDFNNRHEKVDNWLLLFTLCNLCIYLYFWAVVFMSQKYWAEERNEEVTSNSTLTGVSVTTHSEPFDSQAPSLPVKC
ncbi:uncharacterized protein LOC106669582 [Cimex lectularius]|uniref:Uncharacterized protein n=1 Tax=Cimex lectularius TaxID=79782 RepID=A0A8I6TJ99_CIMLE|nr:uncharacterized protein LOC106669582 [Cimex lectularius]